MKLTTEYVAGLFDSGAAVNIYGVGMNYTPRVLLSRANNAKNIKLFMALVKKYGGSVTPYYHKASQTNAMSWQIGGSRAVALMAEVRPYLRLKDEVVDVVLNYSAAMPAKKVQKTAKQKRHVLTNKHAQHALKFKTLLSKVKLKGRKALFA